jgi:hypothetical protein
MVFLAFWIGHLLPDRPALEAGRFSRQILGERWTIGSDKESKCLESRLFWACGAMKVFFAAPGLPIRAQVYLKDLFMSACIY